MRTLQKAPNKLVESVWNPATNESGALPVICGTIVSSIVVLPLAVPLSMRTALFIAELCSRHLRTVLSTCIEMLAAISRVIYSLRGICVLMAEPASALDPIFT